MPEIDVRVTAHWVNGWLLRTAARPYLVVNGGEREVRWGRDVEVEAPSGDIEIGAGIRYLGRGPLLGFEPQKVDASAFSPETSLEIRNGPFNHMPFRLVERSRDRSGRR